jgi:hypothetical protein
MTLALAGAVLAWTAVAARTTAQVTSSGMDPLPVQYPACVDRGAALQLPPGHPDIGVWLPPGHPPIGHWPRSPSTPRLPSGHPSIDSGASREPAFPAGFLVEI